MRERWHGVCYQTGIALQKACHFGKKIFGAIFRQKRIDRTQNFSLSLFR